MYVDSGDTTFLWLLPQNINISYGVKYKKMLHAFLDRRSLHHPRKSASEMPLEQIIPFKNVYFQGLLVLQGRSIAKNLNKVAWFFVVKKGLRRQIGGNLFLDISDDFYLQ